MPRYRTLAEVAEELRVSPQTLKRRIKEAGLSLFRPGRAPLLSDGDVLVLLEATRARNAQDAKPPLTPRERREQMARDRQVRAVRLTNEAHDKLLAQYDAKPLSVIAERLGISVLSLRYRIRDAGIRPARLGRGLVLNEVEIAQVIEHSRSRGRVYWKDPDWLRPPKPEKVPLTREELGQRIREGKERMRKFWAQPHLRELTQKWRAAEEERKQKARRKRAAK